MRLTQRDKTLLTIIVLVVVWVMGIVFFIKPKIDEVSSKSTQLQEVETKLASAELDVKSAKTIKDDCNTALKDAQKGAQNFYNVPKAYEAERHLAEVLAGNQKGEGKIEISSLNIQGPSAVSLSIYNPDMQNEIKVPINDAANISGETGNTNAVVDSSMGETLGCYTYTVSFKAYRKDLMKFLTNVKATESGSSLVVTALTISDNNVKEDEKLEGSMSFTLYFVKKLDGDNVDEIIEQQINDAQGA